MGAVNVNATTQVLPGPGAAVSVTPVVPGAQVVAGDGTIAKSVELAPVRYKLVIVNGPLPEFVSVVVSGVAVVVFGN